MTSSPLEPQILENAARHLQAWKYFQIAACVVLVYDHILTFSEEVERVWKKKITGVSILFLINRYVTPLLFIVIIDAFDDPIWTRSVCNRFVSFEGFSTVALIAICEIIMILRTYALYGQSRFILIPLMALWILQLTSSSIAMHAGFPLSLPPGFVGCIFTGSSTLFPAVWVTPLITDSVIFPLTIWRTRNFIKEHKNTLTIYIFSRDGAMYFFIIFLA
ncbi:hypothetical protein BDZ94DRAFT_1326365, partial [Collybia nuda]